MQLVDGQLMQHVNFRRMTALATGPAWRTATPEQQKRLLEEFKTLLVRTYSGALTQVKDQTVQLKPMRAAADDPEVVVRTEVKGKGDPIQLDYRLEKTPGGWKIYDVNVLGVWLADTSFKSQFAPVIANSGLDGLIGNLAELNRKAAARN
jgi:phospholipid transport system substrate-binding protein